MRIVNVVATCEKVVVPLPDAPYEELKNGKKYYFPLDLLFPGVHRLPHERVVVVIFHTGKVKIFSPQYPLPNLPYFSDCKIENLVAVTEIPAAPLEELLQLLEKRGFVIGDREKVNAVLAYRGKTTVRIFPKTGSDTYKAVVFARSEEDVKEAIRLLTTR
jgi:TATA-box binding protein (TBP) (component of TFIID and TFIIIB)